jgi:biopolymer transport protein ExbD
MKRLGKKKEGDISPDLTSFSDIANLLIIFFILTTSLARPFGRQMEMPSSAKPPEEEKQKNDTPTVNLSADRITISEEGKEGRELTMDELRAELWKRNFPSRSEKDRAVVLETSDDVTYDRYYKVASAIAAAGGVIAILEN